MSMLSSTEVAVKGQGISFELDDQGVKCCIGRSAYDLGDFGIRKMGFLIVDGGDGNGEYLFSYINIYKKRSVKIN